MADIFLSYPSEDRQRIVPLARLLEGWNVVAQNNGVGIEADQGAETSGNTVFNNIVFGIDASVPRSLPAMPWCSK